MNARQHQSKLNDIGKQTKQATKKTPTTEKAEKMGGKIENNKPHESI